MSGVSGFAATLTALTKARRPSARVSRDARPGEKPLGWVVALTTGDPRRRSSAERTSGGSSFQSTRTPSAGGLEKDTPPKLQVLVDSALDRVPDVIGQRHDLVLVLSGTPRQLRHID